MRRIHHVIAAIATAALAVPVLAHAQAAPGEEGPYLVKGGTVVSPDGQKAVANILVRNNRIVQVGPNVTAADAKVIDAAGKYIYPGMVDANTGIGLTEIGSVQTTSFRSELGQFNPHLKALVGLNVESEILGVTRMNGVTSVVTTPTGGAIAGQATLINTAGWTYEDLAVTRDAGIVFTIPSASGAGGGGRGAGFGGGRGGRGLDPAAAARLVADFNQFMQDAKSYDAGRAAGSTNLDLVYESMRPLFAKKAPALVNASSEQQIREAVAFGDKWGVRVVIMGGKEAWKVRRMLADKQIPVVLGPIQQAPNDDEPYDEIYAQPGLLYDSGVKFAFSTGGGSNARHVAFHAALAVAYGLKPEGALKALTIWPAEIFGADKEIGSVTPGKLANFFITTGDPMDLRTQVTGVFIKGREVPDDDRQHRLYIKYKNRPLPKITP